MAVLEGRPARYGWPLLLAVGRLMLVLIVAQTEHEF